MVDTKLRKSIRAFFYLHRRLIETSQPGVLPLRPPIGAATLTPSRSTSVGVNRRDITPSRVIRWNL